ncbi:MAG: hypothetical protein LLG42_15580 [Chloroflexi bacterium]|nr:hypothetical protein [Chloroflexota bacterium]
MTDFVSLTCPNCGEKLQMPNDVDRFVCGHCGTEQLVDKTASELAIKKLEQEITNLSEIIQETTSREGYKKNIFYVILLVISALFTLASLWAWFQYEVIIWMVFLITGILVFIMSTVAVRQQSKEFLEQNMKLKESLQPYQAALERKQKELNYHKAVVGMDKKAGDQ